VEPRRELDVYMHRTRLAPALGKAADARRLLGDHVRHLQGQGQRLGLSERIFSSEWPMFLVTHVAAELADIERVRRSRLTDPDFQGRAGQVVGLLSEPPRASLWESVVDMAPNPPPTTIGQLVFLYPSIGKQAELEVVLSEVISEMQKIGQRTSLWRRIYSSGGPMFQTVSRYADLADLDRSRKAVSSLLEQRASAVAGLSRAPAQRRLSETIVPLPPV
jgi:hypothetical protein